MTYSGDEDCGDDCTSGIFPDDRYLESGPCMTHGRVNCLECCLECYDIDPEDIDDERS